MYVVSSCVEEINASFGSVQGNRGDTHMHMNKCLFEWSNSVITLPLLPANAAAAPSPCSHTIPRDHASEFISNAAATSIELSATAMSIFLLKSASLRFESNSQSFAGT